MTNSPPNPVFIDTSESSAKKVEQTRKRKATEMAKESGRKSKYSKTDDSVAAQRANSRQDNAIQPADITDNVSPEHLEDLKKVSTQRRWQ